MRGTSRAALLRPHLRQGLGTSVLIALLVASTVFIVALAPRALALLGTAELQHEFAAQRLGTADLNGEGRLGIPDLGDDATLDQLVGETDTSISAIPGRLPAPLADAAGDIDWVVRAPARTGSTASAPTTVLVISLAFDLRWEERVTPVDGTAPAPWVGGTGPIDVAMSSSAAKYMDVVVGDTISLSPVPLRIAEIYDVADPADVYWAHARDLLQGSVIEEQGAPPKVQASVYVAPETLVALREDFAEGNLSAWVPMDAAAWDYADREQVQVQARKATATPRDLPNYGELNFRSSIVDVLDAVQGTVSASSALIALSASGFLGVLVAAYALCVQALIRRRGPALALLDARGARRGQLRGIMVLETAAIVLPGAAVAIALAAVLLPARVDVSGWLAPIVVTCIPIALAALLLRPSTIREARRDLGAEGGGSLRWVAEVAVVGLAVLALVLLQRRGLVESSAAVGIDPLLAATPILIAAAVGMLVLRLYPLPLRVLAAVARRRTVPSFSLGVARAIREPAVGAIAALALVVGMSIVIFTVVMVSTVGQAVRQSALDDVGADLRLTAHDLPESLVTEVRDIPGVTAVAALVTRSGVSFSDESGPTTVTVVLADTTALHAVRPDIPVLGQKVGGGPIPVLISDDWDSNIDGTALSLVNSSVAPAGTIGAQALPGMSRNWILVDSSAAGELGLDGLVASTVLATLADDAAEAARAADAVASAAEDEQPPRFAATVDVRTAAQKADELAAAPAVGAVQGTLVIAAAATLALSALVVALATAAAAARRGRTLGVVRVLGMSRRQVAVLTAWELAPVAVVSLLVAVGLGLVLPSVILSVLDLRGFVGGIAAPVPTIEPLWVLAAAGLFAAVVVLASVVATLIGRRVAPAKTIRMGE
ncbi:hypothetical protein BH11ACT5_BH11ACT5_10080 [soil metagenome]